MAGERQQGGTIVGALAGMRAATSRFAACQRGEWRWHTLRYPGPTITWSSGMMASSAVNVLLPRRMRTPGSATLSAPFAQSNGQRLFI